MSQMSRIREQATESEAVVRNITKDIQRLDLAKKNLMTSMTFLKRLQMLGKLIRCVSTILTEAIPSERLEPTGGARPGEEIC